MEKKLFEDLLESVNEMNAIRAGTQKPARVVTFEKNEISKTRERLKMTQKEFAAAFGISLATLRNWEQGHRQPSGAARVLLKLAQEHPRTVRETVLKFSLA